MFVCLFVCTHGHGMALMSSPYTRRPRSKRDIKACACVVSLSHVLVSCPLVWFPCLMSLSHVLLSCHRPLVLLSCSCLSLVSASVQCTCTPNAALCVTLRHMHERETDTQTRGKQTWLMALSLGRTACAGASKSFICLCVSRRECVFVSGMPTRKSVRPRGRC